MKQQQQQDPAQFRRLWGWPIVLGLMTAAGLVSALFSDGGPGDVLAWVTLGIPTAICFWYGWGRRRR